MLGITTSDAIALGSMIAALTAVCAGLVQGGRASARTEGGPALPRPDTAAPESLDELTAAVRDLAQAIRTAVALARARAPLGDRLDPAPRNDE